MNYAASGSSSAETATGITSGSSDFLTPPTIMSADFYQGH